MATKKPRKEKGKGGDTVPPGMHDLPAEFVSGIKIALVKEALEDPAFRKLALSNPASAIQRSRFISDGEKSSAARFKFRVVEETQRLVYLVIPHKVPEGLLDAGNPKHVLLRKAVTDEKYFKQLTTNPKSVIESEFLVDFPPGLDLKVLKETQLERVAVLPADLHPGEKMAIPDELIEYHASKWGCGKTNKPSTPGCPPDSLFQSPTCPGQTLWPD